MDIIPKISEYDFENLNNFILNKIKNIHKCEIQMLQDNLNLSFENTKKVIETFDNNVKYIVIHLPFTQLYLDLICFNDRTRLEVIKFVKDVVKYSIKTDINIDILFHINPSIAWVRGTDTCRYLDYLLTLVNGTNVGILIENCIVSLNEDDEFEASEDFIFEHWSNPHLKFCLDICHLQASENAMNKEMRLSDAVIRNTKNIHFSMTLDHDGYRDKKRTHGRRHFTAEDVKCDLEYLENKGINIHDVNIVAEINEEDYTNRPDLIHELYLFERLNKDYML